MADGTYAGVAIPTFRTADNRLPVFAPEASPNVYTELAGGNTLVTTPRARRSRLALDVEFPTYAAYVAMTARIGSTPATLVLVNGVSTITYTNTLLDLITTPTIGAVGEVTCQLQFSRGGYG